MHHHLGLKLAVASILMFGAVGATAQTDIPYDSISVDQIPCGGCWITDDLKVRGLMPNDRGSEYHLTLSRDGLAELRVNGIASQVFGLRGAGSFSGTVMATDYLKLCQLMNHVQFDALQTWYGVPPDRREDGPASTTIKSTRAGSVKSVSMTASDQLNGPVELWALQKALDAVAHSIRWSVK